MFFTLALAGLVCAASAHNEIANGVPTQSGITEWKQLNVHEVCFEGRHDRYGSLFNYIHAGLVGAIKLEYISGHVRCVSNVAYNSRWGCGHYSSFVKSPLNVVITDRNNHVIFPKKDYVTNAGLWYWHPFVSDSNTKDLVFSDFAQPFYLPQYEQIRIWYGEDLKNWAEGDNQGRVCVNVYARFIK